MPRRAVFLDRDGVINAALVREGKPYPPPGLAQLRILPGVPEALLRLKAAGFALIVVTNQPDVARGTQTRAAVEEMHRWLAERLPLDDFRACYHDSAGGCDCRKPAPGMLLAAGLELGLDLAHSYMVGDRWRDMEAGQRAGCGTIFIDYQYDEPRPSQPDAIVHSLSAAADWILSRALPEEKMPKFEDLHIKIFADGADWDGIRHYAAQPYIKGFTTNPSLMRAAGITDYKTYARRVIELVPDRPLSFEVTTDDFDTMERQAREIAGWGSHVYVKIPITNTRRESSCPLVRKLSLDGVKLNVTAMMTLEQVRAVGAAVAGGAPTIVSVFAGRVADTGRDPVPHMAAAVDILRPTPNAELLWASPRELLNIFQADAIGCQIITVTHDVLKKLALVGKDLGEYSLETVQMFYNDAGKIGYA